jgi:protein-S-isoprenylcysteine O-methyltransferase Ste14
MTTVALVGFAYLVVAFAGRAWLLRRRSGTAGWRGVSGRPGSASWWGGVLFAVALILGLAAPVAGLAGLEPVFDDALVRTAGLIVFLVGTLASIAAQAAMGAAWRVGVDADERTELVGAGPFALARNPFFTGLLVTALGLALMVPNVVAGAALLALVVAVELQVRVVEEPHLRRVHGPAYLAYASRVGRFLPALGRLDPSR